MLRQLAGFIRESVVKSTCESLPVVMYNPSTGYPIDTRLLKCGRVPPKDRFLWELAREMQKAGNAAVTDVLLSLAWGQATTCALANGVCAGSPQVVVSRDWDIYLMQEAY